MKKYAMLLKLNSGEFYLWFESDTLDEFQKEIQMRKIDISSPDVFLVERFQMHYESGRAVLTQNQKVVL